MLVGLGERELVLGPVEARSGRRAPGWAMGSAAGRAHPCSARPRRSRRAPPSRRARRYRRPPPTSTTTARCCAVGEDDLLAGGDHAAHLTRRPGVRAARVRSLPRVGRRACAASRALDWWGCSAPTCTPTPRPPCGISPGPEPASARGQLEAIDDLVERPRARPLRPAHRMGQVAPSTSSPPSCCASAAPARRCSSRRCWRSCATSSTAAARLGLRAHTVNSTNQAEWDAIARAARPPTRSTCCSSARSASTTRLPRADAAADRRARRAARRRRGALHQRLGPRLPPRLPAHPRLLDRLPADVAVLCTTATANDRVVDDVAEQLGRVARATLRTFRGSLARDSLRLEVVDLPRPAERLAWLSTRLPQLEGSGIVYCLTVRDSDRVAAWLSARHRAPRPTAGDRRRPRGVEARAACCCATRSRRSSPPARWAWATTSPTSASSSTTSRPGSVIAYYQQVGRAGRALDHADVVLLRGRRGPQHPGLLHRQAFPPREAVDQVLRLLGQAGDDGLTLNALLPRREPRAHAPGGDAEGPRRRGRGAARRQPLALAPGARRGPTTRSATAR